MLQFANIEYLLLLLLIPFFFVFYALSLAIKKKRMSKFGDYALVRKLMPTVSTGRGWAKVTLFSIAFFFFTIGLSRPQLGARVKEHESRGVELMIALDVSNSMLAEDYAPNRLERAKLAISRLVDRMKDDRIGLIVFAGESFVQLPITTDYVSAKIFLNTINTSSVPVQGTALADAIRTGIKSFSLDSENSRAIVIITDGENHEEDPIEAAKLAYENGIRVFAIGVGSSEGKPIPMENGELLKDKDGNIVVTRLDEKTLMDIADVGGGTYVRAGGSEFGLNPIIDELRNMEQQRFESVVFVDFDEQYMYFFAIALVFFIIEMLIGNRKTGKKLFV